MTYLFFTSYYAFVIVLYKFTRFSIYFLFLFDKGPTLERLDFTIRIGSTQPFYISICIYTLPMQHTTFIIILDINTWRIVREK